MNTVKSTADAMTRAAQIAASELKQLARDAGTRERDFRIRGDAKAIAALLANDPTIVERATEDLRRWILAGVFGKRCRAKLLTFEQNARR
jgi:hypothetical protein